MGGKSKSSTSSDQSQRVLDQSASSGNVAIGGSIGGGKRSTTNVTLTDHGAIEGAVALGREAFDFGSESLSFADSAGERATGLQRDAMNQVASLGGTQMQYAQRTAEQIAQLAESFQSGGANRDRALVMWIGAGVAVTVAVVAVVMIVRSKQ